MPEDRPSGANETDQSTSAEHRGEESAASNSADAAAPEPSDRRMRELAGLEGSRLAKKAAELGASEPGTHAGSSSSEEWSRDMGGRRMRQVALAALAAGALGGAALAFRSLRRRSSDQ